jgi:hypothetical protein
MHVFTLHWFNTFRWIDVCLIAIAKTHLALKYHLQ